MCGGRGVGGGGGAGREEDYSLGVHDFGSAIWCEKYLMVSLVV